MSLGLPRQPQDPWLLRKNSRTLFRWTSVAYDVQGNARVPDGYRVYRSDNTNLETFTLVVQITTLDIRGLLDTMFSEDLEGFYAYGVTAYNAQGESSMAVVEAVNSNFDADLFG